MCYATINFFHLPYLSTLCCDISLLEHNWLVGNSGLETAAVK
jgi:hypothetical protein